MNVTIGRIVLYSFLNAQGVLTSRPGIVTRVNAEAQNIDLVVFFAIGDQPNATTMLGFPSGVGQAVEPINNTWMWPQVADAAKQVAKVSQDIAAPVVVRPANRKVVKKGSKKSK